MQEFFETDGVILLWIQEHLRNDMLTPFFKGLTYLGNFGAIMILTCIVLMAVPKTRKLGMFCSAALIVNVIINNLILKNLIDRTRPYEVIEGLKCIVIRPMDASFPSGHTSASFSVSSVIFGETPRHIGIAALTVAALIGFSRLYVGVHYPTDVVFGMLSGILIGLVTCAVCHKYVLKKKQALFRH